MNPIAFSCDAGHPEFKTGGRDRRFGRDVRRHSFKIAHLDRKHPATLLRGFRRHKNWDTDLHGSSQLGRRPQPNESVEPLLNMWGRLSRAVPPERS